MPFDFPAAPAANEEFTSGGVTYIWTGLVWDIKGGGAMGDYLPLAGGTMTGDIKMNGGAGLHFDANSAVTVQHDYSKGICIYGSGTASQFGFYITSGTLNYGVQQGANQHQFVVGTENKLQIKAEGLFVPTVANAKNGYFIGDRWHGMYFHGGNTTVFTEYHDRFEWRHQTSGSAGAGNLRMSLYSGNLSVPGSLTITGGSTFNARVNVNAGMTVSEALAVIFGISDNNIGGGSGNGGIVYRIRSDYRHKFFVGSTEEFGIDSGGGNLLGASAGRVATATGMKKTKDGGINLADALVAMMAEIKTLKSEIETLKRGKR